MIRAQEIIEETKITLLNKSSSLLDMFYQRFLIIVFVTNDDNKKQTFARVVYLHPTIVIEFHLFNTVYEVPIVS